VQRDKITEHGKLCLECDNRRPLVDPDNEDAWKVFNACSTQWIRAGMEGVCTGLFYPSLEVVLNLYGLTGEDRTDCFERVRILEAEALSAMAEARRQAQPTDSE